MIRNAYDRVYNLLKQDTTRQLRSNDKLLQLAVWEREGLYLSDSQKDKFLHATSSETITRARRKIQEQGFFLANRTTQEKRAEKEAEVKSEVMNDRKTYEAVSWIKED